MEKEPIYCERCKQRGVNTIAKYDIKTMFGPRECLCEDHFRKRGIGLSNIGIKEPKK